MKKVFIMVLTLALFLSCMVTPASAKTMEEDGSIANPLADTSYQCYVCPKCNTTASQTKTWTEYNYYYVRVWATMVCPQCGYTWNTVVSEIANNVWYVKEPAAEAS